MAVRERTSRKQEPRQAPRPEAGLDASTTRSKATWLGWALVAAGAIAVGVLVAQTFTNPVSRDGSALVDASPAVRSGPPIAASDRAIAEALRQTTGAVTAASDRQIALAMRRHANAGLAASDRMIALLQQQHSASQVPASDHRIATLMSERYRGEPAASDRRMVAEGGG